MFKYVERPIASSRMTVTRDVSAFTPCVVPSFPLCRDPTVEVSPCTCTLVLGALTLIVSCSNTQHLLHVTCDSCVGSGDGQMRGPVAESLQKLFQLRR